jgi:hypothetical protein
MHGYDDNALANGHSRKKQSAKQYLPYATPAKMTAPVPVPKAANGRLQRHRKRYRGHHNQQANRAYGGAAMRGPYAPRGRNLTWQPKGDSNHADPTDANGHHRVDSEERGDPLPVPPVGQEIMPRKDIIRKLNADFEARKAAQDARDRAREEQT